MSVKQERRDFIGIAFGAVAAVGGAFSLVAMKKTWDPLPSVKAAGFTTVDLSPMKDGEMRQVEWRKKPIFILKKDPNSPANDNRDIKIGNDRYTVVIGLCTHLGCIPEWKSSKNAFICACHGGEFDADGLNVFGPPPRPLDIPPFKIDGTKLVLGETGPEYNKLVGKA
ncbi:ubiquinol-cytochrome c reductase iron-sulfur subunit [Campylobacter pinnipediorum]|uniref:Ubiquinol cytochrome c oxidoreductase PetABC, 2Fe-2S subunit n=2 Tax=Campylobacter pinnipediorum TaxID=1965231 RepID=A0A1S6U6U0_9BACT|nr:ubiquinol-cytochrome c reductase iron-sulfur subunit [Campylobacter pinnipediorum]AQW80855.1 ubiquinol cytochrome c oxidoreductase PetABC, 2Fe-2S subunit [Campylobacter pinnipediorum subsp. pinnipediorum]AQW82474.1 ubiquinol cytochrome c oxidoreductase PetABC, 2Fe-2S subunit [Campylobacter pinnipediorum subsp. pinnipediorum]AQW84144.1 ubiquinol cytochrome c oxidoreductase PetABC, 2Fe-2S subunit [Campylobacter pinnipediorum subsp. pinnipediorum]AQW85784.1 ubiquinol cytochrome c oxidoreductase